MNFKINAIHIVILLAVVAIFCIPRGNSPIAAVETYLATRTPETPGGEMKLNELREHYESYRHGGAELNDYPYIAAVIEIAANEKWPDEQVLQDVQAFVQGGCLLQVRDEVQAHALHYAAFGGYKKLAAYLQENSLFLTDTDSLGRSPLMYALMGTGSFCRSDWTPEGTEYAKVHDGLGHTLAHYASQGGRTDELTFLEQSGVDIHAAGNSGITPIMTAAYGGAVECMAFLQQRGAQIQQGAPDGVNAILYAAYSGSIRAVEFCVENGMSLHAADAHGQTLAHHAAYGGHVAMLEYLAQKGVSLHGLTQDGRTPLDIATMVGCKACIEFLRNRERQEESLLR